MLRFPYFPAWRSLCFVGLLLLTPGAAQATGRILVLGDSLSAGYGIPQENAWPVLLEKRLQQKRLDYSVVNASISGETSSGGRSRLAGALARNKPQIVIIALGSNDGLRGLPIATLRDNLLAMITMGQQASARVLLVGQRLPPNYGAYATEFQQLFGELAKTSQTALVDFLLADIATRRELFQADNLHPTAEAQPILLETLWKGLEPLLK